VAAGGSGRAAGSGVSSAAAGVALEKRRRSAGRLALADRYYQLILLEGNLLKPGNPYCRPMTNRLVAEELKYSHNRARRRQRPSNNLLEVWQNSAIFGSRPIGAAVEALLTIIVNQQLSLLPIGFVFVAAPVSVA
jgi:hypothetical protein